MPNESNHNAYLLPVDVDGAQTELCLPISKLYQELNDLKANHTVVFMDACFSGAQRGNASGDILDLGCYNFYPQTKYLVNMAYLRMKNITVGYTLPKNIVNKVYLSKVRVYASINNAFDIINHNNGTGLDPEINTGVGSYGNAVWGRTDPIMRSYSFGIQIDL